MSANKDFQSLWWPKFDNLYETLRHSFSASSAAHVSLGTTLREAQVWLQLVLQGFKPPAQEARAYLENEAHWFVANGKKVPIKAELRTSAVLLSSYLGLNELQAYLLVYRSPAPQQAGLSHELSFEQLQELKSAYFMQRNCLLSSIYQLLSQQDSATTQNQHSAAAAVSRALDAGLDTHLCAELATNCADSTLQTMHGITATSAKGTSRALILSNNSDTETQRQQDKQQLLFERELLLSILLCIFSDWKPCTPDCFQLMQTLHLHVFSLWHSDKTTGGVTCRAMQLAQVLSVQFLTIPDLLSALNQGHVPSPDKAPLLVSGQNNLCHVFMTWLDSSEQNAYGEAGLTAGHSPAMLAFAAAVTLLKDMPGFSGQLADIDPAPFANKAAQLNVLPTLAAASQVGQMSPAGRTTLLNLICAAIAAFDLSPYTLSASQLQAVVDILANLYEGQEELCSAFHNASQADHWRHAPVRQFYQQTLELLFEDPKPVLQLWYSLAGGLEGSDAVANMLENPVLPTMRATGSEKLAWLDESQTQLQAMEDMVIPNSAALMVSKGTKGRVLQKARFLVEQEATDPVQHCPLLTSSSTSLVLWLPNANQSQPKSKNKTKDQEFDDRHLQPGNDVLLGRAWAHLQKLKQANEATPASSESVTELLLIIKLFARLARSRASIGHDLLRVKQGGEQGTAQEAGRDALDLACQVTDVLCRMQGPYVELLGACIELMSALAMAFPGYAASLASKSSLLRNCTGSSRSGGSHRSHDLPMLKHVQRVWEGAAGVYPVTTAFLSLTEILVIAGVNKACVKSFVGFTLNHILGSCHSWRYTKRSQRWGITTAALQVLQAALASPRVGPGSPDSTGVIQPDWTLAQAVAQAVSQPAGPAAYLFNNLPPHADDLDTLLKRQGREAEASALEAMAVAWLQLLPLLVQACKSPAQPSAFLQDLFQAPAKSAPSAASVLASYMAYPFEAVQGTSLLTTAVRAGQALAVAASSLPQGQVSLARCLLQGPAGVAATSPVSEALVSCFQYNQAMEDPLAFAAAVELLITAFDAPHPSLLALLMTGSSLEAECEKENSSQLANVAPGAAIATPPASKKDSGPSCLAGLWEILQHAQELLDTCPAVIAHTLHVLAVMWQAGEVAALPIALLRRQADLLTHVAACIQHSAPELPDPFSESSLSEGQRIKELLSTWQESAPMAWRLVAESHALTIVAIEAFSQPRRSGGAGPQADVWALLDRWSGSKGADGLLLAVFERYTIPLWGPLKSQAPGLDQARLITHELYLEAETKLIFMFAFMAHFEADDLGKHTAGHTLLAALWQRLSPVLETYCQDQGMDPAVSVEGVLEGLGQVLARREPSSAQWKDLEASACRYKDFVSSGQDAQLSFHQDARQVLLLHDIRQLHLTEALLQAGLAHHRTTMSRAYDDNFLYDEEQFEDVVGDLMVQRTGVQRTGVLQDMFRACSMMAGVQQAQVQAVQALAMLSAVMARPSPALQGPPLPTPHAAHILTCLRQALSPLVDAAPDANKGETLWTSPGLQTHAAHCAIARSAAQTVNSQLQHWKPKQAPSLLALASAPEKHQKPPKPAKPAPSRLAHMSNASSGNDSVSSERPADLAIAEQLLRIARLWLAYERSAHPAALEQASTEPITHSLLSSLFLVLRRIGLTNPPATLAHHHQSQQAVHAAACSLLPELCQLAACQGCHASMAASLIPVMLRACFLSASDALPVVSEHLHLVQAMSHAFHAHSAALRASQSQGGPDTPSGAMAGHANADLEGTLEGALLALALHLAQSALGAQMLLDQGAAEFVPALAKWLLRPHGDLLASAMLTEPPMAQDGGAVGGRAGEAQVGGMYNSQGHPTAPHQQWCALLGLAGVLVRNIERDDRLDRAVVTLLVIAQDRMLTILTPPEHVTQQPLTLALLQEVEKVLFLATCVPHLKGQWQMATQGPSQGPGPGTLGGPLAMRQACCVFLEFAALAVSQGHQPPCCPPVSPYEKSMATASPELPIAEAWFKATAVGSAPHQEPPLPRDPHGSQDQAAVAATEYSCQVAEAVYTCLMLALKLLTAFCPEVGPQQMNQIGLGWPSPVVLKALQKQCHAMAHSRIPERSRRALSLVRNIQASLKLSWHLLDMLPIQIEENELKDYTVAAQKLQSLLDKQ